LQLAIALVGVKCVEDVGIVEDPGTACDGCQCGYGQQKSVRRRVLLGDASGEARRSIYPVNIV